VSDTLTEVEKYILNDLQDRFPIASRPYRVMAERFKEERGLIISEEDLILKVKSLKDRGYFRRLGGIFNSEPLGYRSTLCCAKVPEEKVAEFGERVSAYPQVTHNYVRSNPVNIWFTFCYTDPAELRDFLQELKKETGVSTIYAFDSRKVFKIRAIFDLN
jgi:DNA-binding Lrp family transcriptional regulator